MLLRRVGLGRGLLGGVFEADERIAPESLDRRRQLRNPGRVGGVQPPSALTAHRKQPGLGEHPKMLRNGRPADRKALGKLAHSAFLTSQKLEDRAPGRVAKGVKLNILVSLHLR